MRPGDVIFVWDNSLISKIISFFDKGKYSHCCICVSDDNQILEAQYPTKSRIVPFPYQDYDIIDLGLSDFQRNRVKELAPTLTGHRYDLIQILSYFIKDTFDRKFKVINNPKNYICSEIVEILLQDVGVIPNTQSLRDKSPNELYEYLKSLQGR